MPVNKLLVAYDGSEGAKVALRMALELSRSLGARVTALWVRGALPHYPETTSEVSEESEAAETFFAKLGQEVADLARGAGSEVILSMAPGHPAQTILKVAKEEAVDLIVVGSRGHSSLWDRMLGHTADRVSEAAPCSVLIAR